VVVAIWSRTDPDRATGLAQDSVPRGSERMLHDHQRMPALSPRRTVSRSLWGPRYTPVHTTLSEPLALGTYSFLKIEAAGAL